MNVKSFLAANRKFYNVKRSCRDMYCGILLWLRKRFVAENCIICPLYPVYCKWAWNWMTKSSAKFLPNRTKPNLPKSAEPRTEPNRNFGRFLCRSMTDLLIRWWNERDRHAHWSSATPLSITFIMLHNKLIWSLNWCKFCALGLIL